MPTATVQDLIIASATDLTAALQLPNNSLLPPPSTITHKALLQLSNIFSNRINPNDDIIVSINKPQPEPLIPKTSPPTVPVPRVHTTTDTIPNIQKQTIQLSRVPKYVPPSSTQEFLLHNNARKSLRRQIQKVPSIPPPPTRRSANDTGIKVVRGNYVV